ncbi:MAG: hypothetical protein PUD93_09740 [Lachnospiraceae bacterium]|nr:hypothetical protein [Lachnospiraceae bacterium]
MRIGGIGNYYGTYVYNPNILSSNSMQKLSRISDDVLDKKIDYSGLVQQENENPLEIGETSDFESVLAKQFSEGYQRAAKIFPEGITPIEGGSSQKEDVLSIEEKVPGEGNGTTDALSESRNISYQMQRAIQAYEMTMSA